MLVGWLRDQKNSPMQWDVSVSDPWCSVTCPSRHHQIPWCHIKSSEDLMYSPGLSSRHGTLTTLKRQMLTTREKQRTRPSSSVGLPICFLQENNLFITDKLMNSLCFLFGSERRPHHIFLLTRIVFVFTFRAFSRRFYPKWLTIGQFKKEPRDGDAMLKGRPHLPLREGAQWPPF